MTQEQEVLLWLKYGRPITQAEAIDFFRCYRRAAVIKKLRDKGQDISTERNGKSGYARYRLERKAGAKNK